MRKQRIIMMLAGLAMVAASCSKAPGTTGLKDALEGKFLIGAAINESQILGEDSLSDSLLLLHFNAISPENCLKSEEIQPRWGEFNWTLADKYVDFGTCNGFWILGHVLIWHSQCTPDFCHDSQGRLLDAETLKARMKEYITTVMGRYKGRINGWDVVNEAIMEDGSWRESPFYQILGEEYIPWAFECAHEADPDCELYYNDYNMFEPGKRATVVRLIRELKARGLRIDAVGMQSHVGMDYPDMDEYTASIDAFIAEGVDVAITEMDMSALPTISRSAEVGQTIDIDGFNAKYNPFPDGLSPEVSDQWNARMKAFLDLYLSRADHISRVTAWGVTDKDSWKNNFIVPRTDYPLFFDRKGRAKPFVQDIIANAKNQ